MTIMDDWPEYRKTATIRAKQINHRDDLPDDPRLDHDHTDAHDGFIVRTLEGPLFAPWGSYLAIGIDDELYPIADDIFQKTYEPEDQPQLLRPHVPTPQPGETCPTCGVYHPDHHDVTVPEGHTLYLPNNHGGFTKYAHGPFTTRIPEHIDKYQIRTRQGDVYTFHLEDDANRMVHTRLDEEE